MIANVVLPSYSNKYIQNIGKEWTCVNCSTPNKNKIKFVWVSIINRTVPPLKKKKGKKWKVYPKMLGVFWILNFEFCMHLNNMSKYSKFE